MFDSDETYHEFRRITTIVGFSLITVILVFIKLSNPNAFNKEYKSYPGGGNEIVMYSLSTCGYCTQKREQLKSNHIRFKEYFIDKDRGKENEMLSKLKASGDTRNYYTVPVLDIYGYMIPGNPSYKTIESYIDKYTPKVNENTGLTEFME